MVIKAPLLFLLSVLAFFPIARAEALSLKEGFIPPLGDRSFSISTGGQRAGFVRNKIAATPDGYEIVSESAVKMSMLGFSRSSWSRETYRTTRDLSLVSFSAELELNGNRTVIRGEAVPGGFQVRSYENEGKLREKFLKRKRRAIPGPLLNLYPLMHEPKPGRKFKVQILDTEEGKLRDVNVEVVGKEIMAGVRSLHLRNNLYPFVDNDIWIDEAGNTIRESVRDGLVETVSEPIQQTRKYLLAETLSANPLIVPFTVIKPARPIPKPEELRSLVLEISGIPENLPLLSDARQETVRLPNGNLRVTLQRVPLHSGSETAAEPTGRREVTGLKLTAAGYIYSRWVEARYGFWYPFDTVTGVAVDDLVTVRLTDASTEALAEAVGRTGINVLETKYEGQ